jgi:hypothetical protein
MNSEQENAVTGLRQAVTAILPELSFGPGGRGTDLKAWLGELERGDMPSSQLRAIAASLRIFGGELERQTEPPTLAPAAVSLIEAANAVLVAF